ncbi:AAA family ATPase [Iodobacter sp. CM08]|uniref:AAA family ATPase n=1 Tax=Iodobacter sp. CM08 TaxID=3085902 RepID=UPI00298194CD|nr:AAA family ATPase [Iodobacter sp. CM08]MDW5416607.1 AAA family ATPase [Iodobacter sp. CM08]
MITEILIDKVASYKSPVKINPINKTSLLYGLNGAGKSTISNYLYDNANPLYEHCRVARSADSNLLVYNQLFLRDYFHEEDSLKGIFTLSKENKDILIKIEDKSLELNKSEKTTEEQLLEINNLEDKKNTAKTEALNKVWEIKTKYTGGDRVFEYCLEGLKIKDNLFNHIKSLTLPNEEPADTIDSLKRELASLQGDKAYEIKKLEEFTFSGETIEKNGIFKKVIVGKQDGTIAEFISTLGNLDWVRNGLQYLPNEIEQNGSPCPFCQAKTITKNLFESITDIFDEAYEKDISSLNLQASNYFNSEHEIKLDAISDIIVVDSLTAEIWKSLQSELNSIYQRNIFTINEKIKSPSSPLELKSSEETIKATKKIINDTNLKIEKHNENLKNKKQVLLKIKKNFWQLMRYNYDQTLANYLKTENITQEKIKIIQTAHKEATQAATTIKEEIAELRKKTVNIEEAIANINNGLKEIGIDGFSVIKHDNDLYRISRSNETENAFFTLSEGEKTVISFLYFIELCKGEVHASATPKNKIVVIDDPISSLSHIYVFNIGQLIKREFINSKNYDQVLIFTHSLYFFYELTHTKKDKRDAEQNLYRIKKSASGSSIVKMKYEEIQNDYQTYWATIKDKDTPPALIANCMRNIVEYFFNFVNKKDFNNVFQNPKLHSDKYQAFYRYMNRESHSIGQNIFDIKEFDYENFKEGLKLIFEELGYLEHYETMIRL